MALLDVVIDYDCNLKCTYCTITDDMRRRGLDAKVVAGHIEEAARRGVRNLSITQYRMLHLFLHACMAGRSMMCRGDAVAPNECQMAIVHVQRDVRVLTELWGLALRAATRFRCGAQVTQKRSSCHTNRCMTPTGHPFRLVHTTAHSVCAA